MQVQTEYTSAMSRKYPEAVVVAIARDSLGKCNPITLGWCMPTSHVPPMLFDIRRIDTLFAACHKTCKRVRDIVPLQQDDR